ncbi:MAG: hypothetical protein JJU40_04445 [Rhodobacteraceae bacterium]|nr:hypothetical protein [Paracoccaceae bacterium]
MTKPEPAPLLLRVAMSGARRIFVTGTLALVAATMVNAGLLREGMDVLSRVVFGATAVLAALIGWRVWTATAMALELREDGLWQEDGPRIAALEDITNITRGLAIMRPANGFALTLREPGPFTWVPGLWWRMGRRVGVGGMTPKLQTRMIGEALEAMIFERQMGSPLPGPDTPPGKGPEGRARGKGRPRKGSGDKAGRRR